MGFDAAAEYDTWGRRLAIAGDLTSPFAWAQMDQHAMWTNQVADRLTTSIIGDILVATVGLEGGGVLVALAERAVVGYEADRLVQALDKAVSNKMGSEVAPWVVLGGVALLGLLFFVGRSGS